MASDIRYFERVESAIAPGTLSPISAVMASRVLRTQWSHGRHFVRRKVRGNTKTLRFLLRALYAKLGW